MDNTTPTHTENFQDMGGASYFMNNVPTFDLLLPKAQRDQTCLDHSSS